MSRCYICGAHNNEDRSSCWGCRTALPPTDPEPVLPSVGCVVCGYGKDLVSGTTCKLCGLYVEKPEMGNLPCPPKPGEGGKPESEKILTADVADLQANNPRGQVQS